MARSTHLSVLSVMCVAVAVGAASTGTAQSTRVLHVPRDYPTIQAAVDNAGEGDIVQVSAGTYYENVLVTKSGLRLHGSSGAVLDGSGLTGAGIHVKGASAAAPVSGVAISGFEIRFFVRGILLELARNVRVRGNDIHHSMASAPALGAAVGIDLITTRFSEISQNLLHHNGNAGIQLRVGSTQNVVRANRVFANGTQHTENPDGQGVLLTGAGTHDNRIEENEIVGNIGRGIMLARPTGTAPITGNLILQNRVHHNQRSGIAIMEAAIDNFVLQNDARWNNLSGLPPCYDCNLVELFTPGTSVWERNLGTLNLHDACMPD